MVHGPLQRREVTYRGHVQGVGFRYTAHSVARGYSVGGFVRNLADGRVELVAEGSADELDRFLTEIRERFLDQIRGENCQTMPATGEFSRFDIRY